MAKSGTVRIDLLPFWKLTGRISTVSGPFHRMLLKWAIRYRSMLQSRFVKQSRGGGEWKRLKRKRKRGQLSKAKILRDTGLLLGALSPLFTGAPGAIQKRMKKSIRVGYGGPSRHVGSRITIAKIAHWHQIGAGSLPVRQIIVRPTPRLQKQMARDAKQAAGEV